MVLGIRPEDVIVDAEPASGGITARVYMSEPLGRENLLTLQLGPAMLRALSSPDLQVRLDQTVGLSFPDSRLHILTASQKPP